MKSESSDHAERIMKPISDALADALRRFRFDAELRGISEAEARRTAEKILIGVFDEPQ